MPTQMSKSQLVEKIATVTELSKRDVKNVMDTLTDVGHKELKKPGYFSYPALPSSLWSKSRQPRRGRVSTPSRARR
jgi:nucleoid DNA-binding protein